MSHALDLAAVDAAFDAFWAAAPSPGLAYGVACRGELVHFVGRGGLSVAGPAPTPHSVFRIASMTKSFTAAALLALRDGGRLALDDPVADHVPQLLRLREPTADSRPLTLRDLVTMSAGLPTDDPWGDRLLDLEPPAFDLLLAGGLRFAHAPGTAFEYSNLGYAILGRAMARAAGEEYRAVVASRILRPLGLHATSFEPVPGLESRLARGHRRLYPGEPGDGPWVELPFAGPGEFSAMGGLFSSVADLAVWMGELCDAFPARDEDEGGHPLRRASRREMQQAHRVIPPAPAGGRNLLSGGYGMGLAVSHDPVRGLLVGHPGGLPGFGSAMRWHPGTGLGVVALANSTYADLDKPVMDALDALVPAAAPSPAADVWPETLQARDDVVRLLQEWDDELAAGLFAFNVDQDEPLHLRRAAAARIREQLGELRLDTATPAESSSPAQLTWWMSGPGGRARIAISLTPESPPAVQTLEMTPEQ